MPEELRPEELPTPESSGEFSAQEEWLIVHLRNKGPEDKKTRDLLNEWLDGEEAKATKINTSKANIELNLRRARLYAAAGFAENALENAEDAMRQAASEGDADLWDMAKSIADSAKEK